MSEHAKVVIVLSIAGFLCVSFSKYVKADAYRIELLLAGLTCWALGFAVVTMDRLDAICEAIPECVARP